MLKKIIAAMMAILMIFSVSLIVFADGSSVEDLKNSITKTYQQALELAGKKSFHGNCNLATAYQLRVRGIYKNDLDFSGAGDQWYDHFKGVTKTSGGYNVVTVCGKNCLYDLVDKYGQELYDIVYSLGTGGTSGDKHVLYIRAIINNMVYFNDSFGCTYGGQYYPEGHCTVLSLDKFVSSYKGMNGDAYGCVYFTNGNSQHFDGNANPSPAVTAYTIGDYVITASSLRIRSQAGTDSDALGLIPNGETVTVTEVKNNWGKTDYNGIRGWISLDYAQAVCQESGELRLDSVTASKVVASVGDEITWTARAFGGSDMKYYTFTLMKDDEKIYNTGFSDKNSVTFTVDEAGRYCVLAEVVDADNNKAELYSDEMLCIDGFLKGDVDGNGKVTASDARIALRAAANLDKLEGRAALAADFNGDEKLTSADARLILRFSAGLD